MVTATEFRALEDAVNWYLTENDYGMPEVEAIMAKIFSNNTSKGTEAVVWARYWTELNIYEEKVKDAGSTDLGQAHGIFRFDSASKTCAAASESRDIITL